MMSTLIDDVRTIAQSTDDIPPLCLSVFDLDAARVSNYLEVLGSAHIVLDAESARSLMVIATRHSLGVSYVENYVRNLIRRARAYNSVSVH